MLPKRKPTLRDKLRDPFEYAKLTQGQKDELNKPAKAGKVEKQVNKKK